jgi:hypothetical protein
MQTKRARNTHQLEITKRRQVRTQKGNERISEAHSLSGERRERDRSRHGKEAGERGNSPSGERKGMDKSGHGKEAGGRRLLTNCRAPREEQIKIRKRKRARGTHGLESPEGGTSQDTERK